MQANVLKQNMTGGISCILLLLFSFLVVPTGNVEGIEPCPTYLSDGSRPCYYCGVVEIGNPSLIVVDGGYLFIAEDSIASNIHNYNDLFKTDGCFVLAEDYVEMEMFLSESEFEEAMKLYKDAMPISVGKKIEGRTDSFLGKYKLNEILGQTFLKLLKPGESFSYNVVQKVKKEPSIKKKISIAKESVVQIYTQFKISECFDVPYLYAYNNLCLYEE